MKRAATSLPKGVVKKPAPKANHASIDRVSVSSGSGMKRTTKEVSVKKIENGYIVCESTYGPKGYSSKETFHAKAPTLQVTTPGKK